MPVKKSEWFDVYHSEPDPSHIYTERKLYSNLKGQVYIKNIKFVNLGENGVINLSSNDIKFLISTSLFENSTNSDSGGSIFFEQGE